MSPQVHVIAGKRRSVKPRAAAAPTVRRTTVSAAQAVAIPLSATALLAALAWLPSLAPAPTVRWSCWAAAIGLLAWTASLGVLAARRQRILSLEVSLRKQHYVQACAHLTLFLYWSAYWEQVGAAVPLIAAQLAFAYAFDALLSWSRRDTYTLGFGPFPIIFSTNLFLWFKPEWFFFQFLMIAVGFAAKELIRWNKEGRAVHIFNPSSFTLSIFSVALILSGNSGLTWGQEIATTQLNPPHMYLLIFLVSLPGQLLFGVSAMTLAAVSATYVLMGLIYLATGTHLFQSPTIPIAVFLGMHLLFTDPSTAPRTELGRLVFGVLYGSSVVALYVLLTRAGVPTFYDKLLPVPILNLLVRAIDRAAQSKLLHRLDPGLIGRTLAPASRKLAYTALWALVFAVSQGFVGNAVTLARADALLTQGRTEEAIGQYRELSERDPSRFEAHNKLGYTLMQMGRTGEALASIRRAVELRPQDAEARNNLGLALIQVGRPAEAVESMKRAVELNPAYTEARYNLGHALTAIGQPSAAADQFREALRTRADWTPALASLAWVEATEGGGVRNPEDALRLATRAADLTNRSDPQVLDVLAAAYAAAGRFPEATETAEAAAALAARTNPPLAAQIRERLSLYRSGRPLLVAR
jgi:tetratricopeptide (TPR) repeat protein